MNQHKKRACLGVLLLMVCAVLLGSCIHPIPGDFHTTALNTSLPTPEELDATTPEEIIPEPTAPQETTTQKPTETTPEATPPTQTTPEQETTTQPPEPEAPPKEKIKIYIDAGHNPMPDPPEDPNQEPEKMWNTGAQGNGLDEADLTFEIAMLLYDMLIKDGRFEVRLSRPTAETILGTDNDSALDFRVNDATEWGADYFISLHINAFTDSSVRGLEVYTASGDDVSYTLGTDILYGLVQSVALRNRGMKDGSHLRVLKNATMPAVLVEMGFISNPDDAALLDSDPNSFAIGVYNGIISYFKGLAESTTE